MPKLVGPEDAPERVQDIARQLQAIVAQTPADSSGRLPSERQLAERFRCSRNTVREALAALAARGLVDIRGRVGAYRVPAAGGEASDLEQALCALGVTVPALARLAAKPCAASGVARLEAVTSNLSQALLNRDAVAAYRWFATFSVELAEIVANPHLTGMLREVRDAGCPAAASRLSRREQIEAFFSGVVELLQALRRGDGQDAAAIAARCLDAFASIMRAARAPRKHPPTEGPPS